MSANGQITSATSQKLAQPARTESDFKDLMAWIKMGDCVVIHSKDTNLRIFHQCVVQPKEEGKKEVETSTSTESISKSVRVISLDVGAQKFLLDEDSWPACLAKQGCTVCHCDLKERVTKLENLPNYYKLSLSRD